MGMSLSTNVFYGIFLGCPEYSDEEEFPQILQDIISDGEDPDDWIDEKLGDLSRVVIETSYYYDTARYYLIIRDSNRTSNNGKPLILNIKRVFTNNWDVLIKNACLKLGIKYSQPLWMAVSTYF